MLINPVILIVTCAIILFSFIYALVNRPAKPMLTGTFIVLFVIYLGFCALINFTLDTVKEAFMPHDVALSICSFLTAQFPATSLHLQDSFDVFRNIDIVLFAASVIAMILELRNIFVKLKLPVDIEAEKTAKEQLDLEQEKKQKKLAKKAEKEKQKMLKKEDKKERKRNLSEGAVKK